MAMADIIVNPASEQFVHSETVSQGLQLSNKLPISQNYSDKEVKTASFAERLSYYRDDISKSSDLKAQKVDTEKTSAQSAQEETKTGRENSIKNENASDAKEVKNQNEEKSVLKPENKKEFARTEKIADAKTAGLLNKLSSKIEKKSVDSKTTLESSGKVSENNQKKNLAKKTFDKDSKVNGKLDNEFNHLNQLVQEVKAGEEVDENAIISTVAAENKLETENTKLEVALKEDSVSKELISDFSNFDENSISKDDLFTKDFKSPKTEKNRTEKSKITVEDLRTEKSPKMELLEEEKKSDFTTNLTLDENDSSKLTMEVVSQNSENNILSLNNQSAAADNSSFQAMMSNQLQQNAPEIVKAGNIVLKDNNQGTIDLVLHPADIGNIKINLSLDGKTITGHITVNTKEALEVFKDNAQTLREAFIKSGFDAANFDVSYSGGQQNMNQQQSGGYDGAEFLAKRMYGDFGGNGAVSDNEQIEYENKNISEYSINIVA